ncbi:MAG: peptide deformylase [Erysipelotrichaceae bacterium]|nr:peptide deformylase [Erysipelotrichaceae bacterium]
MIRPIVRDTQFLKKKSVAAGKADLPIGQDLKDTLKAHNKECVGMAANMIGVNKRIIVVHMAFADVVMYNPTIIQKDGRYETEEGCLSLPGVRPCIRYQSVTVRYQDETFQWHTNTFTGWTAQIIQHECDHLEGILI